MSNERDTQEPTREPAGVASAEDFDALLATLRKIRVTLGMDVIFVSQFLQGSRIFRYVDAATGETSLKIGEGGPLQDSYCQRIVDGRLPGVIKDAQTYPDQVALPKTDIKVGGHLSVPIVLQDGRVYGTLCCFSHDAKSELGERDLIPLKALAEVIAMGIDRHGEFRASGWNA